MYKKILTFLIIFLTGFAVLNHTNFLDYEQPMTYDKINQITFENFRGLEFFKKSLYGNKRFAYIYTSIDYKIEKDSIEIQSFFHPSRSFVYNKKIYSNDLLTHEKYHFKITELYTRIAKKRISELNDFSKNEIKEVIRKTKEEERNFQFEYDDATFHSYVLSEQKKYEKIVDSLLIYHETYKNPKLHLNEN